MYINILAVQNAFFASLEFRYFFKFPEFRKNNFSVLRIQYGLELNLNTVFGGTSLQILQQSFPGFCQFNADIFTRKPLTVIFNAENFRPAEETVIVNHLIGIQLRLFVCLRD